jgi:hypothetical protein
MELVELIYLIFKLDFVSIMNIVTWLIIIVYLTL